MPYSVQDRWFSAIICFRHILGPLGDRSEQVKPFSVEAKGAGSSYALGRDRTTCLCGLSGPCVSMMRVERRSTLPQRDGMNALDGQVTLLHPLSLKPPDCTA